MDRNRNDFDQMRGSKKKDFDILADGKKTHLNCFVPISSAGLGGDTTKKIHVWNRPYSFLRPWYEKSFNPIQYGEWGGGKNACVDLIALITHKPTLSQTIQCSLNSGFSISASCALVYFDGLQKSKICPDFK